VNSFADTVAAMHPMFLMRAIGGLLYLSGAIVLVVNVWKTIAGSPLRQEAPMNQAKYDPEADRPVTAIPAE
jgi:cytochrome c oxidase cbb3-type subunit 1